MGYDFFASKTRDPAQRTMTSSSARPGPFSRSVYPSLQLQRTIGNQGVLRLLSSELTRGVQSSTRQAADAAANGRPADYPASTTQRPPMSAHDVPTRVRSRVRQMARGSSGHPAQLNPSLHLQGPGTIESVQIHEEDTAQRASAMLGAHAFTIGRDIYLGAGLGQGGRPSRQHVLSHEMVHAAQAMRGRYRRGARASDAALERQAQMWSFQCPRSSTDLLAGDPEEIYGFWPVVLALAAGAYVLLRPNVANAPGPEDETLPSVSPLQVAGEACALFLIPELVAARVIAAGGGLLLAGSAAGSVSLVSFRSVQDVGRGELSGLGEYGADAALGGMLGVWAYGPLRAFTTGATGPRLYLTFAGSGAGMGITMRAHGDYRQGQLSSPGDYLLWGGGGALLALGGAGVVRGLDVATMHGLARSDIALSQRIVAGEPLSAEQILALQHTRPDLVGRASAAYTSARGIAQLYRGNTEAAAEIMSAYARTHGQEAADQMLARWMAEGLTREDLASMTAMFNDQPVQAFALPPEYQHLVGEPLGAIGTPATRLPGVAADFARTGGGTIAEGTAIQPTLYVIRVPHSAATPVGAGGYGQQSLVEMEQVLFQRLPPGSVVNYGAPPANLPSLRAEFVDEVGWTLIVPGP